MNVMERQVPRSLEFFRRQTASLTVATAQPAYHFIHVFPPHPPFVMDVECRPRLLTLAERRVQWRHRPRASYEAQARCAWQAVEDFLDRLRALGLYDSSGILIESDHGLGVVAVPGEEPPEPFLGMPANRVRAYANPLLLVKPPHAGGPMGTSHAPTSHFDSAPTVLRWFGVDHPLARHPGYSEVPQAAERTRRFALSGQIGVPPDEQAFHLMTIEGSIRQAASWKSAGVYADVGRPFERMADLPLPGFVVSQ
jgi:arylsulfatase A-like enzyme